MPLLDRNGWKAEEYARFDEFFSAPAIIVPPTTLAAALSERKPGQRVGVELTSDFYPAVLEPAQDQIDLIAIEFAKFSDGRGFSLARMLREQGFEGTLRAVGKLVPDQFEFALHCGFDEVEIGEEQATRQPIEQWLRNVEPITVSYQDTEDGKTSIFKRRAAAARA